MSCLQVIAPGMLTTVQDLGRPGYAHLGVSASGAADALSLRLGNLLVGNLEGAAALEMTLTGGTYGFPEGATFALGGSDFGGELDGTPAEPWRTISARPGSVLRFGAARTGSRTYLCVRGGIRVPMFLGSASTHLLSSLGGIAGRAAQTGDLLRIGREPQASPQQALRRETLNRIAPRSRLRFIWGTHADRFDQPSRARFCDSQYTVTAQANRMGLRLEGAPLCVIGSSAVLSQGVTCGSVQVTNAGQPLILFVEQQTTGGYALIGSIISVDLPSVGQLRAGDRVQFEPVATAEGVRLLRQQERWIASGEPFE